jgi:CheY-like chemotaxis protein
VNDDPDGRQVVAAVLTHCGAEVRAVDTVQEALTPVTSDKPDVLLADIEMPGRRRLQLSLKGVAGESRQRHLPPTASVRID